MKHTVIDYHSTIEHVFQTADEHAHYKYTCSCKETGKCHYAQGHGSQSIAEQAILFLSAEHLKQHTLKKAG